MDIDNPDILFTEMKEDCQGNLEISLFWEEKIIIIIKFAQIYGYLLQQFFEKYPFQYQ